MTGDAKFHFKGHLLESIHGFHCPMALLAGNLLFNVPLMIEEGEFRNIGNFNPGGGGFGVKIVMYLLNFPVPGNNILMTIKTFFYRRYPRKSGAASVRMAELTLYFFHSHVHPVAKRDGLLRANVSYGQKVEKIEKKNSQEETTPG